MTIAPQRWETLQGFLKPYRFVRLKLKSNIEEPVEVRVQRPKEVVDGFNNFFEVFVAPELLAEEAPCWVEEAATKFVLLKVKLARTKNEMLREKAQSILRELGVLRGKFRRVVKIVLAEKTEQTSFEFKSEGTDILEAMWRKLIFEFFPDREDLLEYRLEWSGRVQTRSLASCNIEKRRVVVASAMQMSFARPYLEPLLYHELCHAVLGKPKTGKTGRRIMHGREFKALERRHGHIELLDSWIKTGGWERAVRERRRVVG